jgi:hypothetical protein
MLDAGTATSMALTPSTGENPARRAAQIRKRILTLS